MSVATKHDLKQQEASKRYDELLVAVEQYGSAAEREERINESAGKVLAGLAELNREMQDYIAASDLACKAEELRLEYGFSTEAVRVEPWPPQPIFRKFKGLLTKLIRLQSTPTVSKI